LEANPQPVNNAGAGTGQGKLLIDLTPAEIHKAFALNTFSTLYTAQAAAPHMPSGSRIVNVGSVISRMTNMSGVGVYGASKAAQEYLTGALATEVSLIITNPFYRGGYLNRGLLTNGKIAWAAQGHHGQHRRAGAD
jgi:NAD(P)-dependent dehydrogenase (short-subunit alcohol dehydrogenase family)